MTIRAEVVERPQELGEIARLLQYAPYRYFPILAPDRVSLYLARYLAGKVAEPGTTVMVARDARDEMGVVILQDLPWDTEHFGWRCGKIEAFVTPATYAAQERLVQAMVREMVDMARTQGYAFLWTKCDGGFFPLIHTLEGEGFRLMDCELTLVHRGGPIPEIRPRYRVEIVRNREVAGLDDLGGLFSLSRFHADPRIPDDLADGLWRKSIANACRGGADEVVVLHDGDRPVGFVVCRDDRLAGELFSRPVRSFFLVGVAPGYQGQGVGRELMRAALGRSLATTDLIEVETQARNRAALALYQGSGFQVVASEYAFHSWL